MFLFKLNELTLTDEDTQSKIDERYLRMQVLVPNEVRARAGMSGLKGGDKVVDLKPNSAAALGNRKPMLWARELVTKTVALMLRIVLDQQQEGTRKAMEKLLRD